LWAEAVATACYTQNRSIIRLRHGKTPYELLHNKPSDLSFLHVIGTLCYPINDSENLSKLQPKADIDALTQSCWIEAMQEELNEFERLRNKARLVARGYRQEEGIDFEDSFASVASQSDGFVDPDNPNYVYKLKKSLYGLNKLYARGLQISQSSKGIFINQSKYALESLKKYSFDSCDPVDTPIVEKSKLDKDKEGKAVDPTYYHGMIDTLLYLTANRPDLQFAICMCVRYQAWPTKSTYTRSKGSFAFTDVDHAGCGSMQFLGDRLVSWSSKRKKVLRYPVWNLNISPYLAVVLKFSG
nr:hypothetical protein [Tanacetum cinerariifolium]